MTLTNELAEYFTTRTARDLPAEAFVHVRRLLLDYLGVALRGSTTDSGRIASDLMAETGGAPQSSLIGRPEQVPAMNAAFANAIAEHSIELDDIDELALFHYGPPVISAALAVAEWQQSSGEEFLVAAILGCEMLNRLSLATNPALRDRGYHTTPACGVFAATVAAGHLLHLDRDQLVSALGLAGAQASGLMEMYGPSMQKRFNPGPAARSGVTAALLAARGFTGADTILEGERGFGRAVAGAINAQVLLKGLGAEVPVAVEFKPYSAARPIHNAIDCALAVRRRAGFDVWSIRAITVRRHPDWAAYHANAAPTTIHEAQVSLPYSVAIALTTGAALPEHYDEGWPDRPRLLQLASLVRIEPDNSLRRGVSCHMIVEFADGSQAEATVDDPLGSIRNPMNDADLERKFTMLATPVVGTLRARDIASAVAEIVSSPSVSGLVALTSDRPQ
jgi:2-methylcitrate dehydratase PrpD